MLAAGHTHYVLRSPHQRMTCKEVQAQHLLIVVLHSVMAVPAPKHLPTAGCHELTAALIVLAAILPSAELSNRNGLMSSRGPS